MFPNQNDYSQMSEKDLLLAVIKELNEVKRYAANTYSAVDSEIKEVLDYIKKVEQQVAETDRQVDKIERFEKMLIDIDSKLRSMERKI